MDRSAIHAWLHRLAASTTSPKPPAIKSPIEGAIPLANMFLCLRHGLIGGDELRSFLELCMIDSSPGGAGFQFDHRCRLDDPSKIHFALLKKIDLAHSNPDELLATTIPTNKFHSYILDHDYKSKLPGPFPVTVLPPEPKDDAGEEAWIDTLRTFNDKHVDWAKPQAYLGNPYGKPRYAPPLIICWFTKHSDIDREISSLPSREAKANALRDCLGLIQHTAGRSLLMITFPTRVLQSSSGIAVAQPTFADAGVNRRFAASQRGKADSENKKSGWGTTVHLAKFAVGPADACGVPERISHPVPLDAATFTVQYVGRLTSLRGSSTRDNDQSFALWLRDPHTIDGMIDYIVNAIDETTTL